MQKLTVFYIGATIMVIGILASLLGYQYAVKKTAEDPSVNNDTIIEEEAKEISNTISEEQEAEISNTVISQRQIADNEKESEEDKSLITETQPDFALASIEENDLLEAGFENPITNISFFNGIIFSEIDIKDYRDKNHISYKISEKNEHAGNITEFIFDDNEKADELYDSLATKIKNQEGFETNETNQYGDRSFFANYDKDTNSVFLVVKLKSRLYTLHYPAKNHNKIKNLILSF